MILIAVIIYTLFLYFGVLLAEAIYTTYLRLKG